ncbi:hypothetical protein V5799_007504 [Amblyomma americanum]|uniref:H/ACA ribonucleoprotein complex non-core subunit NAF1 n=1 Tax=Amblyomma americanum TaxID=6943 RepID=A0AAQ4FHF2_AMBAM
MDTSPVEVSQADLSAELGAIGEIAANDAAEALPKRPNLSSPPQRHDGAGDEASENCSAEQTASDVVGHLLKCVENGGEDDDLIVVSTADIDQQSQSVGTKQAGVGSPPMCSSHKTQIVPYRVNEQDTSDSSSSSSSDSDDDVVVTTVVRRRTPKGDSDCSEGDDARPAPTKRRGPGGKPPGSRSAGLKTPGELDIDDLPPIEDLHITLPSKDLSQAGRVRHAVDQLLVVESEPGKPVLDLDSVLFRADGTALGRVFDVLGPVAAPYYTVRFNSAEDLAERGLEPGEPLLYAPLHADVTQYVLESEIRKQRGSDASWENNNEPPLEHLDFSDDEQEREMRKQLRAARSGGSGPAPGASAGGVGDGSGGDERQHASRGRGRGGVSRGGRNRDQEQRQLPEVANSVMRPRMEGPPKRGHFQDSNRPQWPPSQGPQQRWPCSPAAIRFQPNVPPPQSPQTPPWTASPRGNNGMPSVWNTPPPPMAAGALSPSWQQNRPFFNQPPMFPNLRTPPPNFGRLVTRMMMPPPRPPQGLFPAHSELCVSPPVVTSGGQQAAAMNFLHQSPLPSPVYNSAGQRVPLYDPVPDLNRILTSPPPSVQ